MRAFRDVFDPISNREPGPERVKRVCKAYDDLLAHINAIPKRPAPPGADEDAWVDAHDRLSGSLQELGPYCDEKDHDNDGANELLQSMNTALSDLAALVPG